MSDEEMRAALEREAPNLLELVGEPEQIEAYRHAVWEAVHAVEVRCEREKVQARQAVYAKWRSEADAAGRPLRLMKLSEAMFLLERQRRIEERES
jgi:hypothetical protein